MFEIIFLYENRDQDKVTKLKEFFNDKFDFNIYSDEAYLESSIENIKRINKIIGKCKVAICILTKWFVTSIKCKNELLVASTTVQMVLGLFVESLSKQEKNFVSYAFPEGKHFEILNEIYYGEVFETFLNAIESVLGFGRRKKVIINYLEQMSEADSASTKEEIQLKPTNEAQTVIVVSSSKHQYEVLENDVTIQVTTVTTKRVLKSKDNVKKPVVKDRAFIHKFSKMKSSALFKSIYGFKRIAFFEDKPKLILTSTYNQSIAVVDLLGNLLEKKSFGELLLDPWGVCTNGNDEIYIGDNALHRILVLDNEFKIKKIIGENVLNTFYDLTYDSNNCELYAADLYHSTIGIFNVTDGQLKRKLSVELPVFLKLRKDYLFILTTDYILVLNKLTYDVSHTIQLPGTDYINGLYVDDSYHIYTTAHLIDEEGNKSRETYLFVIRPSDKEILKKVNLGLTQVNDFTVKNDRMLFLCDTHVDIFEFYGL